jgi:MFS transporter, ACS family, tartrate transporter
MTDLATGALTSVPWAAMVLGMYFNARHSDRTRERTWHTAGAMLAAAIGLAVAAGAAAPYNFLGVILAGIGIGAAQGIFWTVPLGFLAGAGIGAGVAFINIIGNGAGLIGPNLIAWLRQSTGTFSGPAYVLAGFLVAGLVILVLGETIGLKRSAARSPVSTGDSARA